MYKLFHVLHDELSNYDGHYLIMSSESLEKVTQEYTNELLNGRSFGSLVIMKELPLKVNIDVEIEEESIVEESNGK